MKRLRSSSSSTYYPDVFSHHILWLSSPHHDIFSQHTMCFHHIQYYTSSLCFTRKHYHIYVCSNRSDSFQWKQHLGLKSFGYLLWPNNFGINTFVPQWISMKWKNALSLSWVDMTNNKLSHIHLHAEMKWNQSLCLITSHPIVINISRTIKSDWRKASLWQFIGMCCINTWRFHLRQLRTNHLSCKKC